MSGGAFVTYRKSLKPWPRNHMRFRLAGSDPSWNDMRFEPVRVDAMRCAAIGRDSRAPNQRSYAKLGREFVQSSLPRPVRPWRAAEAGETTAGATAA
jgi:hypothetical protein